MTIEKRDKKDERFWAVNLAGAGVLLLLLYVLTHSLPILRFFLQKTFLYRRDPGAEAMTIRSVMTWLSRCSGFMWGSGVIFVLSYIFRSSRKRLLTGFLIGLAGEAALFLLVLSIRGILPDLPVCFAVLIGNAASFLAVLLHKKFLL